MQQRPSVRLRLDLAFACCVVFTVICSSLDFHGARLG
jgi:hypothetical protein